jgi:adenylosuccinate synthase
MNVIGNGVVVHVPGLFEEIAEMQEKGVKVGFVTQHVVLCCAVSCY